MSGSDDAVQRNGLEQLRDLMGAGRIGIAETLGFDLTVVEEGFVVFEAMPGRHAYNPIGSLHGGYAATLLDSACGCAVHSRLAAGQGYTTLELKTSYHKRIVAETGLLRAEGRVVSFGRRAAFAEARLLDLSGQLYATATSTLIILGT